MKNDFYDSLPPVSEFIERYGIGPLKSLGQNFILDLNLTDRIVKVAGDLADFVVVEVGSGPGALTRSILKHAPKKLIAIEFDKRAIGGLLQIKEAYPDSLEVLEKDALSIDWKQFVRYEGGGEIKVIANLPYNISVPLLIEWLKNADIISSMTLMFQREVAERLAAKPRSKDYGRISIIAQLLFDVKIAFDVGRNCFVPPPKITSSVVSFRRNSRVIDDELFSKIEGLVKSAFSQRRKMIRSTILPVFKSVNDFEVAISSLGILPTARAEEIGPESYLELAKKI